MEDLLRGLETIKDLLRGLETKKISKED